MTTIGDISGQLTTQPDGTPLTTDSYVEFRLRIGTTHKLERLRPLAAAVSLRALMPVPWDATIDERITPEEYFVNLLNSGASGPTHYEDQIVLGPAAYELVESALKVPIAANIYDAEAGVYVPLIKPLPNLPIPESGGAIPVCPFKLLLYFLELANEAESDDVRDRLALTTDKLALLAFMPIVTDREFLSDLAKRAPSGLQAFYTQIADLLANRKYVGSLENPRSPLLFGFNQHVNIQSSDVAPLFRAMMDTKPVDVEVDDAALHVSLDAFDAFLREEIETSFLKALPVNRPDASSPELEYWWFVTESLIPHWTGAFDYHLLYGAVDHYLTKRQPRLNVLKLKYRLGGALMPVVDEIDLRPLIWQREASSLAHESYLIREHLKALKGKLAGEQSLSDPPVRQALNDEFRSASRARFDLDRRMAILKDEVTETGFDVLRVADPDSILDSTFVLARRYEIERITVVPRVAIEHEPYFIRRTIRLGFVTIRRVIRRTRTVMRRWFETVVTRESVVQEMPTEWRPVENYLSQVVPVAAVVARDTAGNVDQERTAFLKRRLSELVSTPGSDGDAVLNRQKEVRTFSVVGGRYVDQRGEILEDLVDSLVTEDDRLRMLLLVPIYETRPDGQREIVKYLAVHNPTGIRSSSAAPTLYLVETHRHSVEQERRHCLGPLAHTVTLFPGEKRRVRISSENRFVSTQKQESRTSQKVAVETKASLQTQLRNELENESRKTTSSNWSANASGSMSFGLGSVGGGASAGGSSESSKRELAKRLHDVTRQTMETVSRDNEVQFSTAAETGITEVRTSEQIVEFENLNQARSVTHKFFQLSHRFRQKISIVSAKVVVEYPDPIIPGTDILRTRVYELADLEEVADGRIAVRAGIVPEMLVEDVKNVLEEIRKIIRERYETPGIGKTLREVAFPIEVALEEELYGPHEWSVNSGAFYLDTEVARLEAVEDYVKEMRSAEVEISKARAERVRAEGDALKAGKIVVLPERSDEIDVKVLATTNEVPA